MATLLEQAKLVHTPRKLHSDITSEHHELAVGWARGHVTTNQVASVLGVPVRTGMANYRIAVILRDAIMRGCYKIEQVNPAE